MAEDPAEPLAPMLRKLQLWRRFDAQEQAALLALPREIVDLKAAAYVVREGDLPTHSCLLISGLAFRQKLTRTGARTILAVHMSGDVVDLQNSLLEVADHSVQALTKAQVAFIPKEAIVDLALRFPNIGLAMWYDTLVDSSIAREWMLNVTRREGHSRIAHIVCEFGVRLESLSLGLRTSYEFPMTQEQLADATGLHPVHVNRTLKELERTGLITYTRRSITVTNWSELVVAGDFRETYLHLNQPKTSPAPELQAPVADAE
jgi:CRP-like cAMP-binding protein